MRIKKKCAVARCTAYVILLPRHLRLCHQWSREKSLSAVGKFGLCKAYVYSEQKSCQKAVDTHDYRQCPVDGCFAVVKRMKPHICKHHQISDEEMVKQLLRQSTLVAAWMKAV